MLETTFGHLLPDEGAYFAKVGFDASPVLGEFFADDSFVTGVCGPLGSGKTVACCAKLMRHAMQQERDNDGWRRTRWAVIRNTYPELRTTTLKTWLEVFPEAYTGPVRFDHPIRHHIRQRDAEGGGLDCEVLFIALDKEQDVKHLKSLEVTGAWVNEATEVPRGVVDMLTGRVGRFPPSASASWRGIIMDTNAPDDQNWWYDLAETGGGIEGKYAWKFYKQQPAVLEVVDDGPRWIVNEAGYERVEVDKELVFQAASRCWVVNPDGENIKYLPEGYYEQQIQNKSLEWIQRFLQAKYIFLVDGKPWVPEYSDTIMAVDLVPSPDLPLYGGIDAGGGTLNPAAVVGQRGLMGDWRIIWELSLFDIGLDRFTDILKQGLAERFPGLGWPTFWLDPAGRGRDQIYETAVEDHFRSRGLTIQLAPTQNLKSRREALALPMTRLLHIDGKVLPGFRVNRSCSMLRAALAGKWHIRKMRVTAERYEEKPEKNEWSHVGDAASYMLLGGGEYRVLTRDISPREDVARQRFGREPVVAEQDFNPFEA